TRRRTSAAATRRSSPLISSRKESRSSSWCNKDTSFEPARKDINRADAKPFSPESEAVSRSWTAPSRMIEVCLATRRLFNLHNRSGPPTQTHHRGDHVDIDLEEVEVAGHLTQFLALAAELFGGVDGHLAFGHATRRGDECPCLEPFQPRPLRIARKFLFH